MKTSEIDLSTAKGSRASIRRPHNLATVVLDSATVTQTYIAVNDRACRLLTLGRSARLKQLKNFADRIFVQIAPSKTSLGEEEDLVGHFHF